MKTRNFNSGIMERFMTTKEIEDFTEKYSANRKKIYNNSFTPTAVDLSTFRDVIDKRLTVKEASKVLGVSYETVLRRFGMMAIK